MPSTAENRQAPRVPNHEMVRSIGRGSYGEIWLARTLTGMWRAVKIVDRKTFESDKAFQREFEGMAKFEPISREDGGFVDILHVGRDEAGGFFYYVMELADDHLGHICIDPGSYVPKTIKAELTRRSRLLADECITIGLSLTRALGALHRQDLVHRDIKPANIIFVGGVPKIADIGLVAASGQDSYVGTEGYMPPEGPGTPQADLYSLGKVLYEMAMGKDRMDFPAVNTRLAELPDRVLLLRLNEVLLRACATNADKRYATAEEMHDDLVRVRDGEPIAMHLRRRGPLIAALGLVALLGTGGWYAMRQHQARGGVRIESPQPGAMIAFEGNWKPAPVEFANLKPGQHKARVMLADYEPVEMIFEVERDATKVVKAPTLQRAHGTAQIESRPPGAAFELRQGETVVRSGLTPATVPNLPTGDYQLAVKFEDRIRTQTIKIERDDTTTHEAEFAFGAISVNSHPPGAEIFLDGKRAGLAPLEVRVEEGDHELVAKYRNWPDQRRTVQATMAHPVETAFEFSGGSVKITSSPSGASVWQDDKELGFTPLLLEDLDPGVVKYEFRLTGYKNTEASGEVKPGEQAFVGARFVKRLGPRANEPWENSLAMKFVPVGRILMDIWPTRVVDYDAFCTATGRARSIPDFAQDGAHPVVKVSWEDATAFAEWLTQKELNAGLIEEGQMYRLPTDLEWSMADGLLNEGGATPEERDGKSRDFPWGKQWPPPAGVGNFADTAGGRRSGSGTIPGYHDGFGQTSPVGSFPANALGLFDMSGNVWQWCRDAYKGDAPGVRDWGVLRGGSWGTSTAAELRVSYRNVVDRRERDVIYGFRCVLVPEPEK